MTEHSLPPLSALVPDRWLTTREAQSLIPCGRAMLTRLVKSRRIEVRRLGNRLLVSLASIHALHENLPEGLGEQPHWLVGKATEAAQQRRALAAEAEQRKAKAGRRKAKAAENGRA